jgi:hypothetical protein
MNHGEIDLGLRILDQQLVDWAGRRCGKVDDIIIDGAPGERATVRSFVVGRAAARPRRPWLLDRLHRLPPTFGDAEEVEVAWSEIDQITHVIKLNREAAEIGLGAGDRRAGKWVGKVPHF